MPARPNTVVLTLTPEEARMIGAVMLERADDGQWTRETADVARKLRGMGYRLKAAADVIEKRKEANRFSKRTARIKQARMRVYEVDDTPTPWLVPVGRR